jgi:Ran-binding protein 3
MTGSKSTFGGSSSAKPGSSLSFGGLGNPDKPEATSGFGTLAQKSAFGGGNSSPFGGIISGTNTLGSPFGGQSPFGRGNFPNTKNVFGSGGGSSGSGTPGIIGLKDKPARPFGAAAEDDSDDEGAGEHGEDDNSVHEEREKVKVHQQEGMSLTNHFPVCSYGYTS